MINLFKRRFTVFGTGLAIACCAICSSAVAQSSADKNVFDPSTDLNNQYDEFERRLNAILKTRRDDEKEFVKQVIEKVKQEKLPIRLIDTSFEWVRNKRPYSDYPFYYFERVLRLNAAELGLQDEVPPFSYEKIDVTGRGQPGQQLNAGDPTPRQRDSLFSRFFRFSGLLK